jgi:hypothetical protein
MLPGVGVGCLPLLLAGIFVAINNGRALNDPVYQATLPLLTAVLWLFGRGGGGDPGVPARQATAIHRLGAVLRGAGDARGRVSRLLVGGQPYGLRRTQYQLVKSVLQAIL